MNRVSRSPELGDWVLLAFQRQTNRFVHVARIVSEENGGFWVRFPRNPEATWLRASLFNNAFISTLSTK